MGLNLWMLSTNQRLISFTSGQANCAALALKPCLPKGVSKGIPVAGDIFHSSAYWLFVIWKLYLSIHLWTKHDQINPWHFSCHLWDCAWVPAMETSDDELIDLLTCHRPATCQTNQWSSCRVQLNEVYIMLLLLLHSNNASPFVLSCLRHHWGPMPLSSSQSSDWGRTTRC